MCRLSPLLICAILALVTVGLNVWFVVDASCPPGQAKGSAQALQAGLAKSDRDGESLTRGPANRFAILLAMLLVSLASFAYVVQRKILSPVRTITRAAEEIAQGNLAIALPRPGQNEIKELCARMRDIAANYQEILLLTGATAGNSKSALDRMDEILAGDLEHLNPDELRERLKTIKHDLQLLTSVVCDFRFYEAQFNGTKVFRNEPPDTSDGG